MRNLAGEKSIKSLRMRATPQDGQMGEDMGGHKQKAGWSAERAGRLDNAARRAALPPRETLIKIGLKPGMDFADIGCGVGYFTLPAATIIGPDAKAYALDVSEEMLGILSEKAKEAGIRNITEVLSDEYDMKMTDSLTDFALCCNVIHEIDDKKTFVREIAGLLAQGGQLAVIEWKPVRRESGPSEEERIHPGDLQALLGEAGFGGFEQQDVNDDLYAVVAKKN